VTTYDWMHTFLQGGVLNEEVEAMMTEAGRFGISRRAIQEFLRDQSWRFPQCSKAKAKQLHRIFDEKRQSDKEPNKVKCSCAEALGVYGLLRFFLETAIGDEVGLHNHMASFRALSTPKHRPIPMPWPHYWVRSSSIGGRPYKWVSLYTGDYMYMSMSRASEALCGILDTCES
jgi:hypothetical protein